MNDSELKKAVESVAQEPPSRAVPLEPVPMSWSVSQGQGPEGLVIILHIQTHEGDKVFFLQPSFGKQLGETLIRLSSAADSGLILPQ